MFVRACACPCRGGRVPAQEWSKASQSFADRVTVALQITLGVEYLHSKRFVHRDLKPANALIAVTSSDERVHVKLCDFGLCRNVDAMARSALSTRRYPFVWRKEVRLVLNGY